MSKKGILQLSEDDIRTKIVYEWLKGLGYTEKNIHIEYSFNLKLGKNIHRVGAKNNSEAKEIVHPRTDILVRDNDNKNLMIVEVKAQHISLKEEDKEQALSYARMVQGSIPPFTILTNGIESKIYDSITGKLVTNESIPSDHKYIKAGFRVTSNDMEFRSKALENFISLSSENLLHFCKLQVNAHMSILKSDDIESGKKYIPSLYVERKGADKEIRELLFDNNKNIILLTGAPQYGKTNFICNLVDTLLNEMQPCLFYPASSIDSGLLNELKSDFEWLHHEHSSMHHIVHNKLSNILAKTNKKLFIFLEGWNETNIDVARIIDKECSLLENYNISIIISMTNISARRLMIDSVGNVSHVANMLSLNENDISAIEIDFDKVENKNIISIPKYDEIEAKEALTKYSQAYNVVIDNYSADIEDPFLLRIATLFYKNKKLPIVLDEAELIENFIYQKISRAKGINDIEGMILLTQLAKEIFHGDSPLSIDNAYQCITNNVIPQSMYEAAILTRTTNELNLAKIEFYNDRELHFCIAYWARKWPDTMQERVNFIKEIESSLVTYAGKLAMRWYIKINPQLMERIDIDISSDLSIEAQRLVISALRASLINNYSLENDDWLVKLVKKTVNSEDKILKSESAKLLVFLLEDSDEVMQIISEDMEFFIEILLSGRDEVKEKDMLNNIVYELIRALHWEESGFETTVTDILLILLKNDTFLEKEKALECLAFCSYKVFLDLINNDRRILNLTKNNQYVLDHIINQISEMYYGHMCPGILDGMDEEDKANEYMENINLYKNIISSFGKHPLSRQLEDILNILLEGSGEYLQEETRKGIIRIHPGQLSFDLD